jgi:hypothetical protein
MSCCERVFQFLSVPTHSSLPLGKRALHSIFPTHHHLCDTTHIQVLMEEDMKDVEPSPTSTGSYNYQSHSTIPSPNATQVYPTPASYSLMAYPSESSLCVLTTQTSFHQSMSQFSNSNNSRTSFIQYKYIYSVLKYAF